MAELSRHDPGFFTTPGSYSMAQGDELASALTAMMPAGPMALAPGIVSFKDQTATNLYPGMERFVENRLQPSIGVGWGKRISDALKYNPRRVEISTQGVKGGGETIVPHSSIYPIRANIEIKPPSVMRLSPEEVMAHEVPGHVLQALSGKFDATIPGLRHNFRGYTDLIAGRYPVSEWGSEMYPNFYNSGSTITDPRAFREALEAMTHIPQGWR